MSQECSIEKRFSLIYKNDVCRVITEANVYVQKLSQLVGYNMG